MVKSIEISKALAKGIEEIISVALARHGFYKTPFKYGYWGRDGNHYIYDFVKLSEGKLLEIIKLEVVHGNVRISCSYHSYQLSCPIPSTTDLYLKDTTYLTQSWSKVGDKQFDYDPYRRNKFFPLFVISRVGHVNKKANDEDMKNQAEKVAKRWATVFSDFTDMLEKYERAGHKCVPIDVSEWPDMP